MNMKLLRFSAPLLMSVLLFSCSDTEPESYEANINRLLDENQYEEAINTLRKSDQDSLITHRLKVQAHLAYGHYLTHEADHLAMSDRMASALRHFRRVLELDDDNTQAQEHIDLIEGIYRQMGRDIPEGVAE
ncbi:MAG: hypothetical protein WD097_02100 [Balneolales bacterium]